jgi:hypothetical protein
MPGNSSASLKQSRQAFVRSLSMGNRRAIARRSRADSNCSQPRSSMASREITRKAICDDGL